MQVFISKELDWLQEVVLSRLKLYFQQECNYHDILDIAMPEVEGEEGAYARFIKEHDLHFEDRLLLMLSLVPTLKPQFMDCFHIKNSTTGQRFVEFGCVEVASGQLLLPTLETALFVLAGEDVGLKMAYINSLSKSVLITERKISLGHLDQTTPFHYSLLIPSLATLEQLVNETHYAPDFSSAFPASRISTRCTWDDLVLNEQTMSQINDIKMWIEYGNKVLEEWELKNKIKPGYRVLFHGPSGTGKTFTATLLGKYTNKEVYRVDLSMIVSKYIGETEKNLSNIFDKAEDKNWILFFDEADALFGKRTGISDSHDRYANQEISFLLQRIENYNGLVILSTNLKRNIDEAFIRRFQSIIYFPLPKAEERLLLWKKSFSRHTVLDPEIDLEDVAAKYELTGGSIINIVQYCSLMAYKNGTNVISYSDLIQGIKKEFQKEGKTI